MAHRKSVLAQIETQARVTLALLPLVAVLPFLSDEALARVFGQTMAMLNWTRAIGQIPEALKVSEPQIMPPAPRTREEQRTYWREAKREERRRKQSLKTCGNASRGST